MTNNKPLQYKKRWFTYFDLLGFENLVKNQDINDVLRSYNYVLDTLAIKASNKKNTVSYSWFSDTFILFTKKDTYDDFLSIEKVSRLFFQRLVIKKTPVRGALTIGDLYTQKSKNIFIGKALIDAYKHGENQDWLGFILTPNACRYLKAGDANKILEKYKPVRDANIIKNPENIFAYDISYSEYKDDFLSAIKKMKEKVDSNYIKKYENTEKFIS